MKKLFGFCLLVVILVLFCGCTQSAPAKSATTPAPTTEAATVAPTTVVPTTEVTTAAPVSNETTAEPTVAETTPVSTEVPNVTATPTAVATPIIDTNVIHIRNNTFVPSVTTLLPGTGVIWINDDKIIHSVQATHALGDVFRSGKIAAGSQWSFTFGAKEDTYTVFDPAFPNITSTIIIKKANTLVMVTPTAFPTTASS